MVMYNLLVYSQNYYMTSESLWSYCRDKIDDVYDNASDGKSFKYKTKIVGKTPKRPERQPWLPQNPDGTQTQWPPQPAVPTLNVEVNILLKYRSNFWRFVDLTLINCEAELDLSWLKDCVLIEHNNITGARFQINNTNLCVPVVTFSINDNLKLLEYIKQG